MTSDPSRICYFNACLSGGHNLLVFGRTSDGDLITETIELDGRVVVIEPHIPMGEYHKNIIRRYCVGFPEDIESDGKTMRAFNAKMRDEVDDMQEFFAVVGEFADVTNRRVSFSTSIRDSGIKIMEHPELLKVVVEGQEEISDVGGGARCPDIIVTTTSTEAAVLRTRVSHEVVISMEEIDNLVRVKPFNGVRVPLRGNHLKRALAMLCDLSMISGRPIPMLSELDLWRDVIEGHDWRMSMAEITVKKVPAKTLNQGVFKNINGIFLDDVLWRIMESHESTSSLASYLRKVRFFPGLIRAIFSIPQLSLPDFEAPPGSIGIVDDLLMMEGTSLDENSHIAHSWDILAVLSPGNAWGFSEEEGFSSLGRYPRSMEFPALRDTLFRCLDITSQASCSPNLSRVLRSFSSGVPAESLLLDGIGAWWNSSGKFSENVEDIDREKYVKILEECVDLFTESLQRSFNPHQRDGHRGNIHDHGHQAWESVHGRASHSTNGYLEEVHGGELSEDQGEEPGPSQGSEEAVRVSPSLPEQDV